MSIRDFFAPRCFAVFAVLSAAAPFASAQSNDFGNYRMEEVFPQLKPILEKAVTQSPQSLLRAVDITQAEAGYTLTRSSMLPRLDSSVYYSTNTTSVSSSSDVKSKNDGLFYSVSLSQPLFQWGTLKAQTDSAKIGVKIAEKNFAEAYRVLTVMIRQQYGLLIARKASRRIAAESLRVAQANLEVEEARLRSGSISEGDIIGPRLSVDESRIALQRTEMDLAAGCRSLTRLTGQSLTEADIPDTIPVSENYYSADRASPVLRLFVAAGVDDTLPLQVLADQAKQADLNYKVAKYRLWPKFSLSASASQANSTTASLTSVVQVGVNSRNLNLMATWSIFDGFATSGAKRSALASRRYAERQTDLQRQQFVDAARDMEQQLSIVSMSVRLADTRRALAEDAVRRTKENLARGLGTQKELDGATLAFLGADYNALAQRLDLLNKWAEFLSLTVPEPFVRNAPSHLVDNGK